MLVREWLAAALAVRLKVPCAVKTPAWSAVSGFNVGSFANLGFAAFAPPTSDVE